MTKIPEAASSAWSASFWRAATTTASRRTKKSLPFWTSWRIKSPTSSPAKPSSAPSRKRSKTVSKSGTRSMSKKSAAKSSKRRQAAQRPLRANASWKSWTRWKKSASPRRSFRSSARSHFLKSSDRTKPWKHSPPAFPRPTRSTFYSTARPASARPPQRALYSKRRRRSPTPYFKKTPPSSSATARHCAGTAAT